MAQKLLGMSAEECLAKAEAMFSEMDLQWDLEHLEKVRNDATHGSLSAFSILTYL